MNDIVKELMARKYTNENGQQEVVLTRKELAQLQTNITVLEDLNVSFSETEGLLQVYKGINIVVAK